MYQCLRADTSKFECSPVPLRILLVRLGAGYNERYMSVVRPQALRQERVLHNITTSHVPSPSTDKSSSADMAARDDTVGKLTHGAYYYY